MVHTVLGTGSVIWFLKKMSLTLQYKNSVKTPHQCQCMETVAGMGSSQYSIHGLVVWSALGSATFTFIMQCPAHPQPPAVTLFMQRAGGGVAPGDISIISRHGSADCWWTAGYTPHPTVCPHVRGDTALDTGLPSGLYTADWAVQCGGEWKC